MTWRARSSHPEWLKKVFLNISQKLQKAYVLLGIFLIMIQTGGLQLYYKEILELVFLLCKFLKTLILKTSEE